MIDYSDLPRDENGVPENSELSFKCYRRAAEFGDPDAMNDFGSMLLNGIGCVPNFNEAFKWY